jgi:ubiquitin
VPKLRKRSKENEKRERTPEEIARQAIANGNRAKDKLVDLVNSTWGMCLVNAKTGITNQKTRSETMRLMDCLNCGVNILIDPDSNCTQDDEEAQNLGFCMHDCWLEYQQEQQTKRNENEVLGERLKG